MKHWILALALCATPMLASAAGKFTLSSTDVKAGAKIGDDFVFKGFGCSGGNASPALSWRNAPAGTKSFALTVYDPDAPTGSGWWHWVAFNIPATATNLPQGAGSASGENLPAGTIQSRTDFGTPGYGGPCPPAGDKPHHYIFTLYALKTDKLDLNADSPAAMVGFMINANKLAKASFTSLYNR